MPPMPQGNNAESAALRLSSHSKWASGRPRPAWGVPPGSAAKRSRSAPSGPRDNANRQHSVPERLERLYSEAKERQNKLAERRDAELSALRCMRIAPAPTVRTVELYEMAEQRRQELFKKQIDRNVEEKPRFTPQLCQRTLSIRTPREDCPFWDRLHEDSARREKARARRRVSEAILERRCKVGGSHWRLIAGCGWGSPSRRYVEPATEGSVFDRNYQESTARAERLRERQVSFFRSQSAEVRAQSARHRDTPRTDSSRGNRQPSPSSDSARCPRVCPRGHGMRLVYGCVPEYDAAQCDRCLRRDLHLAAEGYGHCAPCEYDLCRRCLRAVSPPTSPRRVPPPQPISPHPHSIEERLAAGSPGAEDQVGRAVAAAAALRPDEAWQESDTHSNVSSPEGR